MASRASRILAVVHDPGGTQALVPVLEALAASGVHSLDLVAAPFAEPFLSSRGLPFHRESGGLSRERALELIEKHRPTLLLTGTSWQASLEQALRDQAMSAGIPSIVVLDYWSNYALRWQGAAYAIEALADTVCAPDEAAVSEMLALGFPRHRLVVTGQPFLEEMFSKGVGKGTQGQTGHYLFLSQPSVVDGQTISQAQHLAVVVAALTAMATERNTPVSLKIKPHPKESDTSDLQRMVERLATPRCTVDIADNNQPLDSYLAEAECVIGYYTMALFQARAMGRRTVSLAVHALGKGLEQAMRTAGIVDTPLDIDRLRTLLSEDTALKFRKDFHHGATHNVLDVITRHSLG